MKMKLWSGLGAGILLLLSTPGFTDPIRNTQEVRARFTTTTLDNTEIMGFTSTSAANDAANLMQGNGHTLTFASYGRVPYYQILTVTNNSVRDAGSVLNSSPVPEPMSLLLLGSGLTALAIGRRKKNKE